MGKPGQKVLIVDDERMIQRVLRRFLLHYNYVTHEAGGAATALRLFREEQPFHALLCDVYLGLDNGWKLAEQIYALQPSIRIVMITGAFFPKPPPKRFPYQLLLKPFLPADVRKALENHE
jgi:CheY-like chemotaxis protein